jgi:mannose-6-phosphate isomerase-like protein (cupin superfamily)
MIRTGDVLLNPVTGEKLKFVKTSRDTGGTYIELEVTVEPHGAVAAAHLHPRQTERFEVVSGIVGFRIGRKTIEAQAGDVLVVEPGTAHKFWNAGEETAVFRAIVTPAYEFERLIETMFALAADGKTNRKGLPSPLRLAVIAKAHFDDVRLPFPPVWMQRVGLAVGSPLGRLAGYGATYTPVPAGEPAPASA